MSNTDRKRARRAALVLAAVALGGLTTASGANATCYSSTPAAASFADDPADGAPAPEITTVAARLDGTCAITVDPGIADTLVDGDGVFIYLDTDGNPATGDSVFQGADVAVASIGVDGGNPPPFIGRFDPASDSFSFDDAPAVTAVGNGGFSATLDQLGVLGSPAALTFQAGAIWIGADDNYVDFAPEPGEAPVPFGVTFNTTPPPAPPALPAPPAPPAPAPAPGPAPVAAPVIAPVASTSAPKRCMVPAVKRLRLAAARQALRHATCKVGEVERIYSASIAAGRVIRSLPKAGTRWGEPVDLVVSKGRRPRHAHGHAHRASATDYRSLAEIAARRLDAGAAG